MGIFKRCHTTLAIKTVHVLGRAHFTRIEETRVNTFIGTHILYDKVGTIGQRAIYFSHIPLCKSKCNAPNLVLIQAFH
jgi:hypothetical protein